MTKLLTVEHFEKLFGVNSSQSRLFRNLFGTMWPVTPESLKHMLDVGFPREYLEAFFEHSEDQLVEMRTAAYEAYIDRVHTVRRPYEEAIDARHAEYLVHFQPLCDAFQRDVESIVAERDAALADLTRQYEEDLAGLTGTPSLYEALQRCL